MAAHVSAIKHNAAASQMEFVPLQEELLRLLDEYLADAGNRPAPTIAPGNNGNTSTVIPSEAVSQAEATGSFYGAISFRTNQGIAGTGSIGKQRTLDIVKQVLGALGITDAVDIQVVGNPVDVGITEPGASNAYGLTTSNGRVILFADNIVSDLEAFKTIFHELFHLGLSKTLSQGSSNVGPSFSTYPSVILTVGSSVNPM